MFCQGDLPLRVVHTCRSRNNGGLTTERSKSAVKNICKHGLCLTNSTVKKDRAKEQWSQTMSPNIIMDNKKLNVLFYILGPRLGRLMLLTVTSVSIYTIKYMTWDVDLLQGTGTVQKTHPLLASLYPTCSVNCGKISPNSQSQRKICQLRRSC